MLFWIIESLSTPHRSSPAFYCSRFRFKCISGTNKILKRPPPQFFFLFFLQNHFDEKLLSQIYVVLKYIIRKGAFQKKTISDRRFVRFYKRSTPNRKTYVFVTFFKTKIKQFSSGKTREIRTRQLLPKWNIHLSPIRTKVDFHITTLQIVLLVNQSSLLFSILFPQATLEHERAVSTHSIFFFFFLFGSFCPHITYVQLFTRELFRFFQTFHFWILPSKSNANNSKVGR